MSQKIRKTPEQIKRKYNASFRLRGKIGTKNFPPRSKIISPETMENIEEITEVKILLSEFGFIIKPELF